MNCNDISLHLLNSTTKEIDSLLKDIATRYELEYSELRSLYLPESKMYLCKEESQKKPVPLKRGRKKKEKEEFIEAEECEHQGRVYLVDKKNIVYTNNIESPTIVGERLVDGTIKFYNNS